MLLSQFYPRFFFSLFIIDLFAVLSGGIAISLSGAAVRFVFILIGWMIVLVFQVIFSFRFFQNECQWSIIISLRQLKILNNEIFSCFLQAEYADNIYLYERRLHIQKNKCLNAIGRLRDLVHCNKETKLVQEKNQPLFWQKKLDQFYGLLLDYSQLRRRVSDHTTFSICTSELTAICQEIDRLFEGLIVLMLGKKFFPNVSMLDEKILKLEESYHHILQISAREPLVFLLFIFSLKSLSNEMAECYET
jgi:hypothetical protein